MAKTDLSALHAALSISDQDLPGLKALDQADAQRLSGLIELARKHQAAELASASDEALKHVPALLRGAVRKLLFG